MGRSDTAERQGRIELELMEERAAALRRAAEIVRQRLRQPMRSRAMSTSCPKSSVCISAP